MPKITKPTLKKNSAKNDELKQLAQLSRAEAFDALKTDFTGLTAEAAEELLDTVGPNIVATQKEMPWYVMLWHALSNPFVFVLAFLSLVSFLTRSIEGGIYMLVMISVSAMVSFVQEYKSQKASNDLREMIENTTNAKRDGLYQEIPMDEVVPGDIIGLQTGDMIPADAILLSSKDLFINQASLTGESYPVEKRLPEELDEDEQVDWKAITALDAPNVLFMGTDVLSGNGEILIVKTGAQTFFGDIATSSITKGKIDSAFENGLSRVSRLLLLLVAIMFPLVFLINWLSKGMTFSSATDAFFFAIAVAVGLTPEMLPMIVNTNLAKGAVTLSKEQVIVKRLSAIQNLGSMDILCTDKTGTITEDRVVMLDYVDARGEKADKVINSAFINSNYQTGWKNLMDIAVIDYFKKEERELPYQNIVKVDEIPFDFSRRLLSVVVKVDDRNLLVTKGAVEEMQEICTHVLVDGERHEITDELLTEMREVNLEMNRNGMRVLTVAQRILTDEELEDFDKTGERDMTLVGFLGFLDPAKASAGTAIKSLQAHGVAVKVLTGDNLVVAQKICEEVGIEAKEALTGMEIDAMDDETLFNAAVSVNLFAKLNPMQKARIIELLREVHTVGFMGDGINDAPALRAADVGISVDTAADITKDASSIILLEKSLQVLETGVLEGRKVFSNMMKYIRITLSSNFGNVFSVLVASAFLPFLPMLSFQILTLNLIYDLSQLTVPWDHVDYEELKVPVKWETRGLARFALMLGPTSSIFDITTFLVLWFVFGYNHPALAPLFQAGWFAESLATQALAFHILRTKKIPFISSRASLPVFLSTIAAFTAGGIIMFSPFGAIIHMDHLPAHYYLWWAVIIIVYILVLQGAKNLYYHVLLAKG